MKNDNLLVNFIFGVLYEIMMSLWLSMCFFYILLLTLIFSTYYVCLLYVLDFEVWTYYSCVLCVFVIETYYVCLEHFICVWNLFLYLKLCNIISIVIFVFYRNFRRHNSFKFSHYFRRNFHRSPQFSLFWTIDRKSTTDILNLCMRFIVV